MSNLLEITVQPDSQPPGTTLDFHVTYQSDANHATISIADGINIMEEDYSHKDLTELINALQIEAGAKRMLDQGEEAAT